MSRSSLFVFTTTTPHKPLFHLVFIFAYLIRLSSAVIHFNGTSISFSLDDAPARFGVRVSGHGVCGSLHVADPLDGCTPLRNSSRSGGVRGARFALIERGQCDFVVKVRNAQESGFAAAIVYDNRDGEGLMTMTGSSDGILVNAVFVTKASGETLKKQAEGKEGECCILPSSLRHGAWTVLVISSISVLVIVVVLGIWFFTRFLLRRQGGLRKADSHLVDVLPCFTFSRTRQIGRRERETCAICLEDYREGDKLKILPCEHDFHATCIDSWLTKWGIFCPVCKYVITQRTSSP